jgi:hypothetical protein
LKEEPLTDEILGKHRYLDVGPARHHQ